MNPEITELQIGILGGGQLGRMVIQSAIDFNLNIHIIDPDPNAPCKDIAQSFTVGKLTDYDAVMDFGKDKDLITIEIENVNTDALKTLQKMGKKVFPQPEIIELIQDKRKQKTFYKANRIQTADFVLTEDLSDLKTHGYFLPGVHKLGKEGYDGRGVQVIRTEADLDKGFDKPSLLEKLIDFEKEISVIVSRNESGNIACFPVVELVFHKEANLVEYLFAPAEIPAKVEEAAYDLAKDVIDKLDMVGILAVEMFLTKDGDILVNEIAPRTHNSGHHTIEANITSQFEQHLRAILNLPPGATDLVIPAAMVNVLGEEGYTGNAKYQGINDLMAMEGVHLHLYGKKVTKPFRKMGHITITAKDAQQLKATVDQVKKTLKVIA
ncbi:MAG: 5-(carboxyamino)imidazole ribonucleotide synthase [Cyclobacteriaceae bacterium]